MSQAGMIRKLETAGRQKRFDGDLSPHHHMRCRICGAVSDVPAGELGGVDVAIRNLLPSLGCDSFHLELCGVCRNCKNK